MPTLAPQMRPARTDASSLGVILTDRAATLAVRAERTPFSET
jgi:hypothetical protein